nr:hypothetical protein [uncultured Cupriavidus sp.]
MTADLPEFLPRRRRQGVAGLAVLAIGLAMCAWAIHGLVALRAVERAVAEAEAAHTTLKRKLAGERNARRAAGPGAEILHRQTQPLAPALDWLERTASDSVSYARIDVDGNTRSQRVELEARDESSLLALIDALNAAPQLKNVQLVRQQRNTDASGRGSVEATLQLRWQEATP